MKARKLEYLARGVACLGLFGGAWAFRAGEPPRLTIEPGPVVQLADGTLQAGFRLAEAGVPTPPGPGQDGLPLVGIRSSGHGGACLVTDLGQHLSCKADADCAPGEESPLAGGYGYCIREGVAAAGACWWKGPGPEWCLRRAPGGEPLAPGEVQLLPRRGAGMAPIVPGLLHPGRKASYRLVSCLNPLVVDADGRQIPLPACSMDGDQGEELRYGPAASIAPILPFAPPAAVDPTGP